MIKQNFESRVDRLLFCLTPPPKKRGGGGGKITKTKRYNQQLLWNMKLNWNLNMLSTLLASEYTAVA